MSSQQLPPAQPEPQRASSPVDSPLVEAQTIPAPATDAPEDKKKRPRFFRWSSVLRRAWSQSLQFRALTSSGALMILAFMMVGTSISNQIATGLFENQRDQALSEASGGFSNVQSVIDSRTSRSDNELTRDVGRALTVLKPDTNSKSRNWALTQLDGQGARGFIPEQQSNRTLDGSIIPESLKKQLLVDDGVYYQTVQVEVRNDNGRYETKPMMIVGKRLSIPQNPYYGAFVIYDMSETSTTITRINYVLVTGFSVLLVVVLTIVWLVTRMVVRPITVTAITAERLSEGDLSQRVRVRGKHQAARLGISFNKMADSLQEQIEQLEQLSTLQQRFVSDVSHELRTPLTTIQLSSEMLYRRRDSLPAAQVRGVELLYKQVDRFDSMLKDLLEISRFDAGSATLNPHSEDVLQILQDVMQQALPHLERTNTKVRIHASAPRIMADVDRVRMERVLRNLLFNAIEHSESRPIDVYIATNRNTLGIAVRDHGVGLTEEQAAQVFNRFWRADTSRKRTLGGTGLGLSITAEDVRLHNGTVTAWGQPDRGACFTVNVPLHQDQPMGASPVLITGDVEPGMPVDGTGIAGAAKAATGARATRQVPRSAAQDSGEGTSQAATSYGINDSAGRK